MPLIDGKPLIKPPRLAIITSRFNERITQALYQGAMQRAQEQGISSDLLTSVWVPGAVELPLVAQRLARTGRYDALVLLGAVIRGETTHYDYVCQQVSQGCLQVALSHDLPVVFGVLTTENGEQAEERAGGKRGNKGADAIDTALHMISVLQQLST
ncbi:MAG: 6,7-dimethyl-8-ribityllumazine synthase [Gammaproteobacteria bacterium]